MKPIEQAAGQEKGQETYTFTVSDLNQKPEKDITDKLKNVIDFLNNPAVQQITQPVINYINVKTAEMQNKEKKDDSSGGVVLFAD